MACTETRVSNTHQTDYFTRTTKVVGNSVTATLRFNDSWYLAGT